VDTYHHCYNRVAGEAGYFPFGDAEKEYFVKLLKELTGFYVVEVMAFQVMSNHFHVICRAPKPERFSKGPMQRLSS